MGDRLKGVTFEPEAQMVQPDMGGKHQMHYGVSIRADGEGVIGRVHLSGGRIGKNGKAERAEEIMHLIAAAPDLLEAARQLRGAADRARGVQLGAAEKLEPVSGAMFEWTEVRQSTNDLRDHIDLIDAAIAKAEGKSDD